MSDGLSIEVDTRQLDGAIGVLVERIQDMSPVLEDFGAHMVHALTVQFPRGAGHAPSAEGEAPSVQSARLRNSLTYELEDEGDAVRFGTGLVYGRILHFGGVIRPKNAKALAVPISDRAYGKRPADFPGLLFEPTGHAGKVRGFLVQSRKHRYKKGEKRARKGTVARMTSDVEQERLFVLLTQVTIRKHPWLKVERADTDYLADRMREHLKEEEAGKA